MVDRAVGRSRNCEAAAGTADDEAEGATKERPESEEAGVGAAPASGRRSIVRLCGLDRVRGSAAERSDDVLAPCD
ncbi:hypothetical protein GCM10022237_14910 [Nocardioides ginsengisoli]